MAINKKIAVTFSEAMNPLSIKTTTIVLAGPDGTAVSGTVNYVARVAKFTPLSNLAINTIYTVTIKSGPDGVKDLADNQMASNYTVTFTSGVAEDTTAPTVDFTDPANGDSGVAINKEIAVTFSEAMDPLTDLLQSNPVFRGSSLRNIELMRVHFFPVKKCSANCG